MKKIWQKSLASMVSAALCLTAFVGCLTVNAAAPYEGTITGTTVEATAEEATVDLVVSAAVPEGVKGMACAGLKVTTDYGTLTYAKVTSGNAYVETKGTNGEPESETPDIGADGQFIVWASDNEAGVSSFTVRLTFTAENVTAGTTYPVNVEYLGSKDIGAGNWDEDAFTFDVSGVNGIAVKAPAHKHTWGAGVMTTMPTYNTPGIVTYTCSECSDTKTEEVMSISGNTILMNPSSTKVDVPTARLRYGAAVYPAVFSGIAAAGGNVTSRGMLFTNDGTVPQFGNDGVQVLARAEASNSTNGAAFYGGYVGMNLQQMGLTLKFRAFVQFTYNGKECYYYGPIYENSFMNGISANDDEQSVALKNLYSKFNDENVADISEKCATYGTTVAESQHANIITNANSTTFEMKSFRVKYGTAIYPAVFSGVSGTVTERGMLFTTDGTVPEYEIDGVQILAKAAATNSTNGAAFYAGYVGMNLEQIGYRLTFRPYVKYTNADGADAYIYGAAVQFTYIDILKSLASTNELALAIVDYYDTYVASVK